MRWLLPLGLVFALLLPTSASAAPRLDLTPTFAPRLDLASAARAFIDHGLVESIHKDFAFKARWPGRPLTILGGPTPADPSEDPGTRALAAFQYGIALLIGLGASGNDWQDRSRGELPGLLRNADARGGYPVWSNKTGGPPE